MTALRKLLLTATAIPVMGWLALCQAIGDAPLTVRWTPALTLNSLEDIDQRLAAPLEYPLDVSRFAGKMERTTITNCLSYFDLTKQGFESSPLTYQLALGADCHALKALRQAVPARQTHLAGFQLTEKVINDLPPELSLIISKDDARKVAAAHKKGLSWRQFQPITQVTLENDHTVLVAGKGWKVRLALYAFGDFNGDGMEDILIKTQGWLTEGTYQTTRLLALTRSRDSGRLQLATEYNLAK